MQIPIKNLRGKVLLRLFDFLIFIMPHIDFPEARISFFYSLKTIIGISNIYSWLLVHSHLRYCLENGMDLSAMKSV